MNSPELVPLALLLLASALVAGSEAVLLALRREPLRTQVAQNEAEGRTIRTAIGSESALIGVQALEFIVHLLLAIWTAALVSRSYGAGTVALSVAGVNFLSLAVAEIARGRVLTILRAHFDQSESKQMPGSVHALAVVATLLKPFGHMIDASGRMLAKLLTRVSPQRGKPTRGISTQEVNQLLEEASRQGALLHGERRVLLNLVAFGTEPIKTTMTPRTEIDALDVEWPEDQVRDVIRHTRHRRYPVIEGSFDRVLGCVVAKEYCLDLAKGLEGHLRPLPFVPETKVAGDVFQEMRADHNHLALTVDEYGSVEGMVTLNGLVSQLMGEIPDEFTGDPIRVLHLGSERYVVDGAVPVTQLNSELGLSLPVRPNKTVAGLVFSMIGRLPQPGVMVAAPGGRFKGLSLRRHRIVSIEVEKR